MKVPGLRDLAARAPYFHNGSALDLAHVIGFYDRRFQIGLTREEQADLAAFLGAL
jgi:cytochrome c peroxidase